MLRPPAFTLGRVDEWNLLARIDRRLLRGHIDSDAMSLLVQLQLDRAGQKEWATFFMGNPNRDQPVVSREE